MSLSTWRASTSIASWRANRKGGERLRDVQHVNNHCVVGVWHGARSSSCCGVNCWREGSRSRSWAADARGGAARWSHMGASGWTKVVVFHFVASAGIFFRRQEHGAGGDVIVGLLDWSQAVRSWTPFMLVCSPSAMAVPVHSRQKA